MESEEDVLEVLRKSYENVQFWLELPAVAANAELRAVWEQRLEEIKTRALLLGITVDQLRVLRTSYQYGVAVKRPDLFPKSR